MWCMSERGRMRRIGDPVVAAAPAGVRIRTRIHVTEGEAAALTAIGAFLGSLYRTSWRTGRAWAGWIVSRMRRGGGSVSVRSPRRRRAGGRGRSPARSKTNTSWGCAALAAHVADLRPLWGCWRAVRAAPRRAGPTDAERSGAAPSRRRRGYRSAAERFAKTRRLAVLRARLAAAEEAVAAGRPSMVVGGKRLWRTRNHLDAAQITEQQWRDRWDAARMFVTADGEIGKAGGNETIRVDEAGHLRIKTPAALAGQFGSHVLIEAPVRFTHRGQRVG